MLSARIGMSIINKLKNSCSLTKTFSNEDFTDCMCSLILATTYSQMVQHCKGSANWSKAVDAMLEYTYVNISNCNLPLALNTLSDALQVVKCQLMEPKWKKSLTEGKIRSLQGYIHLEMGQNEEAMSLCRHSLAIFNCKLPKRACHKELRTAHMELKQLLGFYILPTILTDHYLTYWETVLCNDVAECLSNICTLFKVKGMWKDAELVAALSLSNALRSLTDFKVICTSYANMISMAYRSQKFKLCVALEVHALRFCHVKVDGIEAEELKAVANLYKEIFHSRFYRSNLENCIHIGYIVLRICSTVHGIKIILPLLPHLMRSLLFGKHVNNAINIVQELDYFASEDSDSTGRIWYYAICITFHLETGYTIVTYRKAEHFYNVQQDNLVTIRDPDARKRFFTVMWLWCIRNEKWEKAKAWRSKIEECKTVRDSDTLSHKFTALYFLEGLILYLAWKMDTQHLDYMRKLCQEIDKLIISLEKAAKVTWSLLPKLYHMKAYYRLVQYNDNQAFRLLQKGMKYALKFNNKLEFSWMEHNEKAWTKCLPSVIADFWKDHSDSDNNMDYRELEMNGGMLGYFTLTPPLYL